MRQTVPACVLLWIFSWAVLSGCEDDEGAAEGNATAEGPMVPARQLADAVHAVIEADRTVYARHVVNRLQDEESVIRATERWESEKTLPLPSQMLRMGAEEARERNDRLSYSLLSLWAINRRNAPQTDAERQGLEAVADSPDQPFYTEETLGGKRYLTAVYADVAVAPACVTCHNEHHDSPRSDFEVGDVMGGVVVRVQL